MRDLLCFLKVALDEPQDNIVNVLDTNERYVLGTQGSFPDKLDMNAYGVKVFVLASGLKPLDPVVTMAYPPHDARLNYRINNVALQFSDDMDFGSLQTAFRFDGSPVPTSALRYDSNTRTLVFDFTKGQSDFELADGIHRIELVANVARSKTSGKALYGAFSSRFLKGNDNQNVVVNPMLKTDANLVSWLDKDKGIVLLNHKAVGAEMYRVMNDNGEGQTAQWSAWRPLSSQSQWYITVGRTISVTVQYYVDCSAAYYVNSGRLQTISHLSLQ